MAAPATHQTQGLGVRAFLEQAELKTRRFAVVTEPRNELRGGMTAASHTTYLVTSVRRLRGGGQWRASRVRRRFRDFLALHASLVRRYAPTAALSLTAPEALVLGGALADPNATRSTMTKRRECQLSAYVEAVNELPFVANDAVVRAFFELEPYPQWEELRNQLPRLGGNAEVESRTAEQAVDRASGPPSSTPVSTHRKWLEALKSPSAQTIVVEPAARFETAADLESRARNVVKAARVAAHSAVQHAINLRRLEDAWKAQKAAENAAFRKIDDDDANGSRQPSQQQQRRDAPGALRAWGEAVLQHGDALERWLGAPMREEAGALAAATVAAQAHAKKPSPKKQPLTDVALRVEAERLPLKFANARSLASARFVQATKRTAEALAQKVKGADESKQRQDAVTCALADSTEGGVIHDVLVDALAAIDVPDKESSYRFLRSAFEDDDGDHNDEEPPARPPPQAPLSIDEEEPPSRPPPTPPPEEERTPEFEPSRPPPAPPAFLDEDFNSDDELADVMARRRQHLIDHDDDDHQTTTNDDDDDE
eukprot:CAMPEP_0198670010 /NCGR_PEP_ID=MMETSP1467-20131203/78639_1 /TAXON_ID=1462469 /ORGANISM="unid. sp., Strain CCMP2135" /LENGTH=540 /DNA_ID=CAMNT_0044406769 /DNA_START=227 /DNA_END=1849 /DNA_ORIENTATION=-